jgi:branched-chain amino acid aminotransferase
MIIHDSALNALKSFTLPSDIGFGQVMAPVMISADYKNGEWKECELMPYGPLSLAPVSKVLHYGQEIFEGLKAYRNEKGACFLFRPDQNARRFNLSATRMAMPTIPEEIFLEAVHTITGYCQDLIPAQSGQSLYLRPFMFATEESLGIKPSESFKFLIVASPSGSYFSASNLKVLIERDACRAAPGGTGAAKTGGNYAASLVSALKVQKLQLNQTLWLDARDKKYIEEMSGMNFFAVIDGVLTTPALTDTILDGITRKSILQLALENKIPVDEAELSIDELISMMKKGLATEAFACGTAAIITPIGSLHEESGEVYHFEKAHGDVGMMIREKLLEIQEGQVMGPEGWVVKVHPPY